MTRRLELDLPDDHDDERQGGRPTPREWAGYVAGAVRRRWRVAAAIFAAGVALVTVWLQVRTPIYRVETTIMAQRQQALPSIGRATAPEDAPTRTAWELVHRRENLLALVKQGHLLDDPHDPRIHGGWRYQLVQRVRRLLGAAPPTADDELSALVVRLDKEVNVTTSEGTVTISFDWFEPQQAYLLVEAAVQNFLEARHLQEVTAMDEAISLLRGRVSALRAQLDRTIEESRGELAPIEGPAPRPVAGVAAPSDELVQARSMLEAKERAIADVEEFRRRRQSDLQAQLDAQRAVYSEAHPTIIALRHDLEALSRESPQVAPLREEVRRLRAEYAQRLAQEAGRQEARSQAPAPPRRAASGDTERVRQARFEYQQMVERMNAAQLDLDAARAAFKYRYAVVWPAQVPKEPVSPKPVRDFSLGVLAALLGTLGLVTWLDLRSGLALHRWQVEEALALPVLGELRRR
ncbi:MAG TPA: lipopolysaccharide biosynthesis protein [Anaeromyxobacteraceae bacterium]|nr:lipopolysaccharide biosynthesis protein [Anaeromyxobacteraceae bacterium]